MTTAAERRRARREQLKAEVIQLRTSERMSWAEIARELGITPSELQATRANIPAETRERLDALQPHPLPDEQEPEDWLDDHTALTVVRRVVERQLADLGTTRAAVLAWAEHTGLPPGITIDLLEQYAAAHDLELYPHQAAHRSQLAAALAWAQRHRWERRWAPQ